MLNLLNDENCTLIHVESLECKTDFLLYDLDDVKKTILKNSNVFCFVEDMSVYIDSLFNEIKRTIDSGRKKVFDFFDRSLFDDFDANATLEKFNDEMGYEGHARVDFQNYSIHFVWATKEGFKCRFIEVMVTEDCDTFLRKAIKLHIEKIYKKEMAFTEKQIKETEEIWIEVEKLANTPELLELKKEGLQFAYILKKIPKANDLNEWDIKQIIRNVKYSKELEN